MPVFQSLRNGVTAHAERNDHLFIDQQVQIPAHLTTLDYQYSVPRAVEKRRKSAQSAQLHDIDRHLYDSRPFIFPMIPLWTHPP